MSMALADLRAVVEAGAAKLKPLLQALVDKATPMAAEGVPNRSRRR